ncbi:MAG: PepSY domain-containing protein [Roseibium sp.]|uniref:PepSY domain-containing protein n=1 Tax=Roseibium sp. TaxID=1936156 RepID=UPI00263847D2|nr:PepSY domain-containing protein [Roseibium sp.]MCV0428990.1 PepSY domain-containing protein [Roseibium sp.]
MISSSQLTKAGILASTVFLCFNANAFAEIRAGDRIGLSVSDIAKSLENNGYVIREIEVKTDRIEAEVTLEGDKLEIKIDPQTGLVTRVEDD